MNEKDEYERISELILKFMQNSLTDTEQKKLDEWLDESSGNQAFLESFKDTATIQREIDYLNTVNTNSAWKKVSSQINKTSSATSRTSRWPWVAAATILLCFSLALSINYYKNKDSIKYFSAKSSKNHDIPAGTTQATLELADGLVINLNGSQQHLKEKNGIEIQARKGLLAYHNEQTKLKEPTYNTLKTPKAGQYKLQLPDGTLVWLNAASSLRFPVSFEETERRVELTGEAYFEVAKANIPSSGKKTPFIVSFNGTEVEVLGTHFNINSYTESSRTTLLEGSVRVRKDASARIIYPGQRAIVSSTGTITTATANTSKDIAWKNGLFYFDQDDLGEIMQQVALWYDIKVLFEGKQNKRHFKGTIRRQATLNQVLEMLSAVSGNTFTLKDRTVTVYTK